MKMSWKTKVGRQIRKVSHCFFLISRDMSSFFSLSTSVRHPLRDKYGLLQSRVLWLAGSSSWSSPHKKVRSRVTSFWSSGLGIGWERSRRGVSFGRMRGGWSRKLSKMSDKRRFDQEKFNLASDAWNKTPICRCFITSTQLCAGWRWPGCRGGSSRSQLVTCEQMMELGRT